MAAPNSLQTIPSQITITSATIQPSMAWGPASADMRSGIVMNGPAPIMLVMLSAVAGRRPKWRCSCGVGRGSSFIPALDWLTVGPEIQAPMMAGRRGTRQAVNSMADRKGVQDGQVSRRHRACPDLVPGASRVMHPSYWSVPNPFSEGPMSIPTSRFGPILFLLVDACSSVSEPVAPPTLRTTSATRSAEDGNSGMVLMSMGAGAVDLSAAGASEAEFQFVAHRRADGTVSGHFRQRRMRGDLVVDFAGRVTCLTTDPAFPGRARVGGVITENNST